MSSDLDYRAIRKRVEEGLAQQKARTRKALFSVSLFIYLLFMLLGWGIFVGYGGMEASATLARGNSDSPLLGAMILLSMSGLMALFFQFIALVTETKRGEESIRDRLMAREINREMLRIGADEPEEYEKRKGMMRLTDDGELEVIDDMAEVEVPIKQNRKG